MLLTEETLQHDNARVADGQGNGSLRAMKCFALVQGYFTRYLDLVTKNKGLSGKFEFQVNNEFLKHNYDSIIVHNIRILKKSVYLKFKFKWTSCILFW